MINGEFKGLLNKNIKVKSLYPKAFDEYNTIQKKIISFKLLALKKHIYRKYIENNYDVEVAFLEGPITNLLSVKNTKTSKIAWIHNDINLVFGKTLKSKIKKIYNKKIYSKYQRLVFVSKHNLQKFEECYKLNVPKEVVHNYLNKQNVIEKAKESVQNFQNENTINFLTVARLVNQKAIGRLISVHEKLIKNGYNHKFYVVGDGPLRNELEQKIKDLNLGETFILLGQKENPYPYIKQTDYFCLLSYYEGLPMVLLEAKQLNKYIIITDTASREALEGYENKLIVENSENGIYEGLKNVIENQYKPIIKEENDDENKKVIEKISNILGE